MTETSTYPIPIINLDDLNRLCASANYFEDPSIEPMSTQDQIVSSMLLDTEIQSKLSDCFQSINLVNKIGHWIDFNKLFDHLNLTQTLQTLWLNFFQNRVGENISRPLEELQEGLKDYFIGSRDNVLISKTLLHSHANRQRSQRFKNINAGVILWQEIADSIKDDE